MMLLDEYLQLGHFLLKDGSIMRLKIKGAFMRIVVSVYVTKDPSTPAFKLETWPASFLALLTNVIQQIKNWKFGGLWRVNLTLNIQTLHQNIGRLKLKLFRKFNITQLLES
jgi:hypothetical protein